VAFSQQHPDITVNIHASNSMDEASVAVRLCHFLW
jgi:hypothetical protein